MKSFRPYLLISLIILISAAKYDSAKSCNKDKCNDAQTCIKSGCDTCDISKNLCSACTAINCKSDDDCKKNSLGKCSTCNLKTNKCKTAKTVQKNKKKQCLCKDTKDCINSHASGCDVCNKKSQTCVNCNSFPCTTDKECLRKTQSSCPYCDPKSKTCTKTGTNPCGPCSSNGECDNKPKCPICDLNNQVCTTCKGIQCKVDEECKKYSDGACPYCDTKSNTCTKTGPKPCGPCSSNGECVNKPKCPICDLNNQVCTTCKGIQCKVDEECKKYSDGVCPYCDPKSNTCTKKSSCDCQSNEECKESGCSPICDKGISKCTKCNEIPCGNDDECYKRSTGVCPYCNPKTKTCGKKTIINTTTTTKSPCDCKSNDECKESGCSPICDLRNLRCTNCDGIRCKVDEQCKKYSDGACPYCNTKTNTCQKDGGGQVDCESIKCDANNVCWDKDVPCDACDLTRKVCSNCDGVKCSSDDECRKYTQDACPYCNQKTSTCSKTQ